MKNLVFSIGMLLTLQTLQAGERLNSLVSGLFFDKPYIGEATREEDQKEGRVLLDCDIESLDDFQSFESVETEVKLADGTTINSFIYLKDHELKIKAKDEFIVIGSVAKKKVALFPNITAEATVRGDSFVLILNLMGNYEKLGLIEI